ncbi:hypothetical protein [Kitasatospora sp. NPDC001175]|uniref:hypothetical protein n=1 Tax=Kitasatospora sp. NPDC001175 TaxID=3157103 RepID=UPI003D083007
MSGNIPWPRFWQGYEERTPRTVLGDLVEEVRYYAGGQTRDPDDAISLAITGAEATRAAVDALDHEWALYAPEQAAVLAAALFAQVDAAGVALQRLRSVLAQIEGRRDCAPADRAHDLIKAAADDMLSVAPSHTADAVGELAALPSNLTLPSSSHDTIAAVADILGAKLNQRHGPSEQGDDENGCGCSCSIDLDRDGEPWVFARGDSRWYLLALNDGEPQPDGTVHYANSVDLDLSAPLAHPGHLAAELRALL